MSLSTEKITSYMALSDALKPYKNTHLPKKEYLEIAQPLFPDLDFSNSTVWKNFMKVCTLRRISRGTASNGNLSSERFQKHGYVYYIICL